MFFLVLHPRPGWRRTRGDESGMPGSPSDEGVAGVGEVGAATGERGGEWVGLERCQTCSRFFPILSKYPILSLFSWSLAAARSPQAFH
jgi:hypothetical protein